jgi:SNF2 family DNA or RNA helicase
MDGDIDPWDWGVDRVVQELCSENRTWPYSPGIHLLPDLKELEQNLREQGMDGNLFLRAIKDNILRKDFGLIGPNSIRYRTTIIEARDHFRSKSLRYLNINGSRQSRYHNGTSEEDLRRQSQMANAVEYYTGTSDPSLAGNILPDTHANGHVCQDDSDSRVNPTPAIPDLTVPQKRSALSSTGGNDDDLPGAASEEVCPRSRKKIKRLAPTLVTSEIDPDRNRTMPTAADNVRLYDPQKFSAASSAVENNNDLPCASSEEASPSLMNENNNDLSGDFLREASPSSSKKRKRLAPTLITSEIDPNRDRAMPTAADNVRLYNPQNIEPDVVYRGDDGKKHLIPVSVFGQDAIETQQRRIALLQEPAVQEFNAGGIRNLESSKKLAQVARMKDQTKKRLESFSHGYLGKHKFSVDNVFFPEVNVGKEIISQDDDRAFYQLFSDISAGRRLYVHRRIGHFMRSQPRVIKRYGKSFTAVIPYPARLTPMYQSPSFTLVHKAPNGDVIATREEFSSWPEVDPDSPPIIVNSTNDDERRTNFNLPSNIPLGGPSSYDNWDFEVELQKYRHVEGDEVLPLYGESDEDGEYDIETWREIEEENGGSMEQALIVSKRRSLTQEEVNEAINEGMAQLHDKWHTERLPKRQQKAWSIWNTSRRLNNKQEQINRAQKHLDRIVHDRLVKMRQEIAEQTWTTQKQVRKQCQIMEQSVFDREDLLWQISVLEQKVAPPKPLPVSKVKRAKVQKIDSEDGESINTDSETESSVDEMDDFIVSDSDRVGDDQLCDDHQLCDLDDSDLEKSNDQTGHDTALDTTPNIDGALTIDTPMTDVDDQLIDIKRRFSNGSSTSFTARPQTPHREINSENTNAGLQSGGLMSDESNFIDLTLLSDSPELVDLVTPAKPVATAKDSPLATKVSKLQFTPKSKSSIPSVASPNVSDAEVVENFERPTEEIPYTNPAAIAAYSHKAWEELGDRDRLLIGVIHNMTAKRRAELSELFSSRLDIDELWNDTLEVMHACRDRKDRIKGMDSKTFASFTFILRLLRTYIDCKKLTGRGGLTQKVCRELEDNSPGHFAPFVLRCRDALESYVEATVQEDDVDEEPLAARRRPAARPSVSDEDGIMKTPRKRQRKIVENAEARQLREEDQRRLAEQESRRQLLRARLASSNSSLNADRAKIIINESKFENEGFIFIHDHIGSRIKNHQIDGIRFMWSQIVSKDGALQGCLLAHTMGLGKTMQVITLLVAIAEAACSKDPTVSSQIPEALKVSRTLILCPPGLIDNWMDELLMWVPEDVLLKIGMFWKVDSIAKLEQRLAAIKSWYNDGGVLIMGFEMFRNILNGRSSKRKSMLMDEDVFEVVERQLLEGPNVIIADEAHKLKNVSSALTVAASRFRSKSRIALTGSPLSNNVEEYHSMIEWIAPNYLGPIVEFRAKYVEPIHEGLYENSSRSERRKGLKMLEVLKEDIAPKVNRADSSVLQHDLQPKIEFVITVPLTELQQKAYTLYVESMLEAPLDLKDGNQLTTSGKLRQTTIWSWIGILALLCNHPECFQTKLIERRDKENNKSRVAKTAEDGDGLEDIAPPVGVSQNLIEEVSDLFKSYPLKTEAIDNSYKTKILIQILDASRAVDDKVLIFSQSLTTLDYLENLCKRTKRKYARLDGATTMSKRQGLTKEFNAGALEIYLISTTAGGLGLNLYGANRVIIFDFRWNPINEEQAVGRAYRIGQKKPVYVYRFIAGGTFEEKLHNKAVFKTQLASQLVDKKSILASAKREKGEFLFKPKDVPQQDLSACRGMDPAVLDKILDSQSKVSTIRGIVMSDTFSQKDDDSLTAEERKEVQQLIEDEKLKRSDPRAWQALLDAREAERTRKYREEIQDCLASTQQHNLLPRVEVSAQQLQQLRQLMMPAIRPGMTVQDSNGSMVKPQTAGSDIVQPPRTPGRDPIMGSGTMSIAEDVSGAHIRSMNPDTAIKSPGLKGHVSDNGAGVSTRSPTMSRGLSLFSRNNPTALIRLLRDALQQDDSSKAKSSASLATSFHETLKRSSGNSHAVLISWTEEMIRQFKQDNGLRDKLFSGEYTVNHAITSILGDIIVKESPKPATPLRVNGADASSAKPRSASSRKTASPSTTRQPFTPTTRTRAQHAAAANVNAESSISDDILRGFEVKLKCVISAAFQRAVKAGQKELKDHMNDSKLHKRISADVCRALRVAVQDRQLLDVAMDVMSEKIRGSNTLCRDLADSKITPNVFVQNVLAETRTKTPAATNGASDAKVGQPSSSSSSTQSSSDVQIPNSLFKALADYGSKLFSTSPKKN